MALNILSSEARSYSTWTDSSGVCSQQRRSKTVSPGARLLIVGLLKLCRSYAIALPGGCPLLMSSDRGLREDREDRVWDRVSSVFCLLSFFWNQRHSLEEAPFSAHLQRQLKSSICIFVWCCSRQLSERSIEVSDCTQGNNSHPTSLEDRDILAACLLVEAAVTLCDLLHMALCSHMIVPQVM